MVVLGCRLRSCQYCSAVAGLVTQGGEEAGLVGVSAAIPLFALVRVVSGVAEGWKELEVTAYQKNSKFLPVTRFGEH